MDNKIINARFKDAPWYEQCVNEKIIIGGIGGIGSNTLYYLGKTIPCSYFIFDDDIVESYNIGTQFFKKDDISKLKVEAMGETMKSFSTATIIPFSHKYNNKYGTTPIMIAAFDNMKARKTLFEAWKNSSQKELFIDGRLRANLYEVYVVTPDKIKDYEYTLFDDNEVDEGPCTFKQTAYFAGLIGARITHVIVNYLSNKYSTEPICNLPFKIEEIGEPFYINISDNNEK